MKVTESKRPRNTQEGLAAMFPYAVIPDVRIISKFQDKKVQVQKTEHVADMFRGHFTSQTHFVI